eukprot:tig00001265_g7888.t1
MADPFNPFGDPVPAAAPAFPTSSPPPSTAAAPAHGFVDNPFADTAPAAAQPFDALSSQFAAMSTGSSGGIPHNPFAEPPTQSPPTSAPNAGDPFGFYGSSSGAQSPSPSASPPAMPAAANPFPSFPAAPWDPFGAQPTTGSPFDVASPSAAAAGPSQAAFDSFFAAQASSPKAAADPFAPPPAAPAASPSPTGEGDEEKKKEKDKEKGKEGEKKEKGDGKPRAPRVVAVFNAEGAFARDGYEVVAEMEDAPERSFPVQVAVGENHALVLLDCGVIYGLGGFDKGRPRGLIPSPIKGTRKLTIIQVACGSFHSAALTEDGRVFTWGRNDYGQLGLGDSASSRPVHEPTCVERLERRKVRQIDCGHQTTAALADDGRLYTWGDSSRGQLGHFGSLKKGDNGIPGPVVVKETVTKFACGFEHMACVTSDNHVWSWGRNGLPKYDSSKIMHKFVNYDESFRPMKVTPHHITQKILYMSAGGCPETKGHTVIVCDSHRGCVYGFGRGYDGQLGREHRETRRVPIKLLGLSNDMNGRIVQVKCHRKSTYFLTEKGEVHQYGQADFTIPEKMSVCYLERSEALGVCLIDNPYLTGTGPPPSTESDEEKREVRAREREERRERERKQARDGSRSSSGSRSPPPKSSSKKDLAKSASKKEKEAPAPAPAPDVDLLS